MAAHSGQGGKLDVAVARLDRAIALLDQRVAKRLAEAGAQVGGLFDQDRAQLATELDAARARQRELEEAGAEASSALAAAMAEIKAYLGREDA